MRINVFLSTMYAIINLIDYCPKILRQNNLHLSYNFIGNIRIVWLRDTTCNTSDRIRISTK